MRLNQLSDSLFKAVSDPTRRKIFHLLMLASSALTINQIAGEFDISRQGITKHIRLLEEADLIRTFSKGRERYCVANVQALQEIKDWVNYYDQFWDRKLDDLGNYLENQS